MNSCGLRKSASPSVSNGYGSTNSDTWPLTAKKISAVDMLIGGLGKELAPHALRYRLTGQKSTQESLEGIA